jgi:Na+:H+ antiporter, NhaA family
MTMPAKNPFRILLARHSSWAQARWVGQALRTETVGGVLVLVAAAIAIVWANSPWRDSYSATATYELGWSSLRLSAAQWSADGLLALFFFVAGLELKRELVVGELRDRSQAILPVVAALAGVAIPAVIYLAIAGQQAPQGWAIPTATDIAFALAALAVMGSHLPTALRSFLLTLAVVDDLVAIIIIAIFYSGQLQIGYLIAAALPLAGFGWLARRPVFRWWLAWPLALLTWGLIHACGIHATVAGIALALLVPVHPVGAESSSRADRIEHAMRPWSAGFAVPLFALFSAGVNFVDSGLGPVLSDRVVIAIFCALVIGKPVGVMGATWLTATLGKAELAESVAWIDVLGISLLAGMGFTVSLLIGELAFGLDSPQSDHAKAAILAGSTAAALLAAVVLRRRERHYREIAHAETEDVDGDGIPDIYQ